LIQGSSLRVVNTREASHMSCGADRAPSGRQAACRLPPWRCEFAVWPVQPCGGGSMKNVTLVALALSFALAACSDSNTGTVSFSLTARQAAAPAGSAAFSSTAAAPAQLVLRKVELKRSDV